MKTLGCVCPLLMSLMFCNLLFRCVHDWTIVLWLVGFMVGMVGWGIACTSD